MRRTISLLICVGAILTTCLLLPATARGQCDWTCNGSGNAIPATGTAKVRLVFIAFSDTPYGDNLPSWKDEFVSEMEGFYDWVSNGKFHVDLEILTPAGQPGKAWMAPNPAATYRNPCGDPSLLDTSDLNAWLIQEAYNQLGSTVWNGVHSLYITYLGNPFGCGVPIPRGVATLGITEVPGFNPANFGFTAQGVTQGFNDDVPLNSQDCKYHLENAMAHEFGHNILGPTHNPNTHPAPTGTNYFAGCGLPFSNSEIVNMGRYAIMDSWSAPSWPWMRPWSYHPQELVSQGWVAKETVIARPCTTTITVPNLRDPVNGKVIEITLPNSNQSFILVNVQGSGSDADLGANGLLIWHMWGQNAWDLESARGKTPDPVNGRDPLEADACEFGAGGDIFDGSPGRNAFTPLTNPNTNFYESTYATQPIVSGIYIMNIRTVGTDMLAEVYLDQPPQIVTPRAGSYFSTKNVADPGIGGGIRVNWIVCGNVVDVQLSDATGTTFTTIADDIPNSGSYKIVTGVPYGTGYKVRVIPDNNPAAALTSGAFLIWQVVGPTVGVVGQDCATTQVQVSSSWLISPTVETLHNVTYWPASGPPVHTNSATQTTFAPTVLTNVHFEPGLWNYSVTLAPTQWGPGIVEGKTGTFSVNGFIRPRAGEQYPAGGSPLPVQWYLCGASIVDVQISDATGTNFTTVADDVANSGSTSVSLSGRAPGQAYKIRIIPDNNPAAAITSDAFTIWTMQNVSVTKTQSCVNQTVTFTASWNTSIPSQFSNTFSLNSPTNEVTTYQWSSNGSSHSWSLTAPCEVGTWNWVVVSSGGSPQGTEFRTGTKSISCPSCPPGCHDCQFEQSIVAVIVSQDGSGSVSHVVKEFPIDADAEISGGTFVTGDNATVFPEALLLSDLDVSTVEDRLAECGPIDGRTAVRMESGSGDNENFVREFHWDPVSVKAGTSVYLAIALPGRADASGIGAVTTSGQGSYVISKDNEPVQLQEDLLIHLLTSDGKVIDAGKQGRAAVTLLALPNPFQSQLELRFGLEVPGHTRLNVYDISGTLVRTVVDQDFPEGEHQVWWDGQDQRGRTTSAGVYFLKLEHPSGSISRKVLRTR